MIEFLLYWSRLIQEETVSLQIVITIEFGWDTYTFKTLLFLTGPLGSNMHSEAKNIGSAL